MGRGWDGRLGHELRLQDVEAQPAPSPKVWERSWVCWAHPKRSLWASWQEGKCHPAGLHSEGLGGVCCAHLGALRTLSWRHRDERKAVARSAFQLKSHKCD